MSAPAWGSSTRTRDRAGQGPREGGDISVFAQDNNLEHLDVVPGFSPRVLGPRGGRPLGLAGSSPSTPSRVSLRPPTTITRSRQKPKATPSPSDFPQRPETIQACSKSPPPLGIRLAHHRNEGRQRHLSSEEQGNNARGRDRGRDQGKSRGRGSRWGGGERGESNGRHRVGGGCRDRGRGGDPIKATAGGTKKQGWGTGGGGDTDYGGGTGIATSLREMLASYETTEMNGKLDAAALRTFFEEQVGEELNDQELQDIFTLLGEDGEEQISLSHLTKVLLESDPTDRYRYRATPERLQGHRVRIRAIRP